MSFSNQFQWVLDTAANEYCYWNGQEGVWIYQSGRRVRVGPQQDAPQSTAGSAQSPRLPPVSRPAVNPAAANAAAYPLSSYTPGYTVRRNTATSSNDSNTNSLPRLVSVQQPPSTLPALGYHDGLYRGEQPRVSSLASNLGSLALGERQTPQASDYAPPVSGPSWHSHGSNASVVDSLPSIDSDQAAALSWYGRGPVRQLSEDRRLDSNFRQRLNKFYRFGRVFKALWPEPGGTDGGQAGPSTTGQGGRPGGWGRDPQYGEPIYTKIRWFIIVRPGSNKSSCITMVTYQGQGVAKQGVVKNEHAIAYLSGSQPVMSARENPVGDERGMQRPIRIQPDETTYTLDPMTRIDYARLYTVEHNVKAMAFGLVHEHDKNRLWYTFRDVLLGGNNDDDDADDNDDDDARNDNARGGSRNPQDTGSDRLEPPDRTSSRNTIIQQTVNTQRPPPSPYQTPAQAQLQPNRPPAPGQSRPTGAAGSMTGQWQPSGSDSRDQGQDRVQTQRQPPLLALQYDSRQPPLSQRAPQQATEPQQASSVPSTMRGDPPQETHRRDRPRRDERRTTRRPSDARSEQENERTRQRRGTGRPGRYYP